MLPTMLDAHEQILIQQYVLFLAQVFQMRAFLVQTKQGLALGSNVVEISLVLNLKQGSLRNARSRFIECAQIPFGIGQPIDERLQSARRGTL